MLPLLLETHRYPANSFVRESPLSLGPLEPELNGQLLSTEMASQNHVSTELTHIVGRGLETAEEQFTLLLEILRTGWLGPSYRGEFGAGTTMRTDPRPRLCRVSRNPQYWASQVD